MANTKSAMAGPIVESFCRVFAVETESTEESGAKLKLNVCLRDRLWLFFHSLRPSLTTARQETHFIKQGYSSVDNTVHCLKLSLQLIRLFALPEDPKAKFKWLLLHLDTKSIVQIKSRLDSRWSIWYLWHFMGPLCIQPWVSTYWGQPCSCQARTLINSCVSQMKCFGALSTAC